MTPVQIPLVQHLERFYRTNGEEDGYQEADRALVEVGMPVVGAPLAWRELHLEGEEAELPEVNVRSGRGGFWWVAATVWCGRLGGGVEAATVQPRRRNAEVAWRRAFSPCVGVEVTGFLWAVNGDGEWTATMVGKAGGRAAAAAGERTIAAAVACTTAGPKERTPSGGEDE